MTAIFGLLGGFVLDLLVGDPYWMPHPVRGIGWLISRGETLVRRWAVTPEKLRLGGGLLTLGVVGIAWALTALIIAAASALGWAAGLAANVILAYLILCTGDLASEAGSVASAMKDGNLAQARHRIARLVGRDTENLDEAGISRAAIETTAENLVDGIISPLLFFMIAGAPGAMAFKAISTLDSMIGYKNDQYRDLGRVSARLDDAANWIGARFAAWFLIPALCWISTGSPGAVWDGVREDAKKHASPNSGYPEAAFARVLGVRLGGPASYGGIVTERPVMNPNGREAGGQDIARSVGLMRRAAFGGLSVALAGMILIL